MVALTQKAALQCPSARIVWGGYSQGAQVTHKAAAKLATSLYSKIAGIVLFGDPYDVSISAFLRGAGIFTVPSRVTHSPAR